MTSTPWAGSAYADDAETLQEKPLPTAAVSQETVGGTPAGESGEGSPAAPVEEEEGSQADTAVDGPEEAPRVRTSDELTAVRTRTETRKAKKGWRGGVRRATFGLVAPKVGPRESAEIEDRSHVNGVWLRTKTVVVANPKGSAGKTPTTAMLAAAFGDIRGGGVVAWDNNETMGTLGQRTVPTRFHTTVLDLLDNLENFERIDAKKGELSAFMRPQESGQFHVLASDEDPAQMIQIGEEEFSRIHTVLSRYYDVIVVDTGNNSRAENFVAAIEQADALVIPTRWSEDSVTRAGKLVDQLRASGHDDLVERAITVTTGPVATDATPEMLRGWRAWFADTTAAVVDVPQDKHIGAGGPIEHKNLGAATRRAYLAAAARVAEQFTASEEASAFRSIKEKKA